MRSGILPRTFFGRRLAAAGFFFWAGLSIARAGVVVMDDFEDASAGNFFGGGEGVLSGGTTLGFVSPGAGGSSRARSIVYPGTSGGHGYYSSRGAQDLRSYKYVSFYVRGAAGGEKAYLLVDDNSAFPKVKLWTFLPGGVTTSFQKVVVSTEAFWAWSPSVDWSPAGAAGAFKIEANSDIPSGSGTLVIDDVRFGSSPSPLWLDNFNDGASPLNFGVDDNASYISPAGAALSSSYDATQNVSGSGGSSFRINFTNSGSTNFAAWFLGLTAAGMDLSDLDTLSLHLRASSAGTSLGISLKDAASTESVLIVNGVGTAFQEVRLPFSSFTAAVPALDLNRIVNVGVWFLKSDAGLTQSGNFSVNVDNVHFVDTSSPTTPTALAADGTAVSAGASFTGSHALTVTAPTGAADPTLEHVGFEYSTDGAVWTLIGVDTDTSNAAYQALWDVSSLPAGGNYQLRAFAEDVQGNRGVMAATVVRVGQSASSPGFLSGTVVFGDGNASDGETGVAVPPGALAAPITLTIQRDPVSSVPALNGAAPVEAFRFGPAGTVFSAPVAVTIRYADTDGDGRVDGTAVPANQLRLYWHDGFVWRPLASRVNAALKTVTAQTSHFTSFALFAAAAAPSGVRPQERVFTPNGDGINDTVHFDNLPAGADVALFDRQGRAVKTLHGVDIWDGTDDRGQPVPNGAYIYQYGGALETVAGTVVVAR